MRGRTGQSTASTRADLQRTRRSEEILRRRPRSWSSPEADDVSGQAATAGRPGSAGHKIREPRVIASEGLQEPRKLARARAVGSVAMRSGAISSGVSAGRIARRERATLTGFG
jgi:hypothetical protein